MLHPRRIPLFAFLILLLLAGPGCKTIESQPESTAVHINGTTVEGDRAQYVGKEQLGLDGSPVLVNPAKPWACENRIVQEFKTNWTSECTIEHGQPTVCPCHSEGGKYGNRYYRLQDDVPIGWIEVEGVCLPGGGVPPCDRPSTGPTILVDKINPVVDFDLPGSDEKDWTKFYPGDHMVICLLYTSDAADE